jgi:hypothetical protein
LGKSRIPVWTPSLLMRVITQVTSLDTSSVLLKRFPWSGFFGTSQSLVGWAVPKIEETTPWETLQKH